MNSKQYEFASKAAANIMAQARALPYRSIERWCLLQQHQGLAAAISACVGMACVEAVAEVERERALLAAIDAACEPELVSHATAMELVDDLHPDDEFGFDCIREPSLSEHPDAPTYADACGEVQ